MTNIPILMHIEFLEPNKVEKENLFSTVLVNIQCWYGLPEQSVIQIFA